MSEITLSYEEIGDIVNRRPKWADFAAWWNAIQRGTIDDASRNLAMSCNVKPGPAELAALCEDWGFLASEIAGQLLDAIGAPEGGLGESYPSVRADVARNSSTAGAMLTSACSSESTIPDLMIWWSKLDIDRLDRALAVSRRAIVFSTPAGVLLMRPPSAAVAGAYQDGIGAVAGKALDADFAATCRTLVLGCAIDPEPAVLATLIDDHPALVHCLHGELARAGRPKAKGRSSAAP